MVHCYLVSLMDLQLFFSPVNGLTTKVIVMQIHGPLLFREVNGIAIFSEVNGLTTKVIVMQINGTL